MAKGQRTQEAATRAGRVTRPAKARKRAGSEDGPLFGRRNYILLGIALASIAAGFATLAGGSITIAPLLLVAGYAVLVPWAILTRGRRESDPKTAQAKAEKPGE